MTFLIEPNSLAAGLGNGHDAESALSMTRELSPQ
jgi:hypothetical protein